MAEVSALGFWPADSRLHRLDVRVKLVCLLMLSSVGLQAGYATLALLTGLILAVTAACRLPVLAVFGEMRFAAILLGLVFLARALTIPGPPIFRAFGVAVTAPGLQEGALICWRLLATVLLGMLLMVSTRSWEIRSAVEWFLRPLHSVAAKRVGTMLGLVLRCTPLILDQAHRTTEAGVARCVENRKNPFYRVVTFGIPFMRRTLERADQLAIAMDARCYNEDRIQPPLSAKRSDWIVGAAVTGLCVLLIFLR